MNAFIFLNGVSPGFLTGFWILAITVIIFLLIFIAYKIYFFRGFSTHFLKKDAYEAVLFQAVLFQQERRWFLKYANGPNPENRTVTVNRVILEAIQFRKKGIIPTLKTRFNGLVDAKGSERQSTMNLAKSNTSVIEEPCSLEGIEIEVLEENELAFGRKVTETLGVNLGKVCPCGENYCDWEADMLGQFIVDTSLWDLIDIQIIDCATGNVISSTTSSGISTNPEDTHVHYTMSNSAAINALGPIPNVKIKFRWWENGVIRCVILQNGPDNSTDSATENGVEIIQKPASREV